MSYELHWNPKHPGHIVYMLDLSGSMGRKINDTRLVDTVMEVMQKLFRSLKNEIMNGDEILDLFSATVIGYNSDVFTLMECKTAKEFNKFFNDSRRRGYIFNTQQGGEAEPKWQTYMSDAFDAAAKDINTWLSTQRAKGIQTPAPVVINITDGDPYEGVSLLIQRHWLQQIGSKQLALPMGMWWFTTSISPRILQLLKWSYLIQHHQTSHQNSYSKHHQ